MVMPSPWPQDPWTPERVIALPYDGNRYECLGGELLVTPAPRIAHVLTVSAVSELLAPFVRQHGLGILCHSPADISLDPFLLVQPDLFVIPAELELPIREWRQLSSLLLVIEVVSPRAARHDRAAKRAHYQGAGIPEYWIVCADARLVERWRPNDARPEIVTATLVWQPRTGVVTLEIALPALFDEVERVAGAPDA